MPLLGKGFVTTFAAVIYEKDSAMKPLQILTVVSALLMVFEMPVRSARADDKPAAAHVPFRLIFNAYDGDPLKDLPEKFSFQINTVDLRQPSEFLKLGETVPKTKWKLAKFRFNQRLDRKTKEMEDISELTLVNTETRQEVVLILNYVKDMAAPVPKK